MELLPHTRRIRSHGAAAVDRRHNCFRIRGEYDADSWVAEVSAVHGVEPFQLSDNHVIIRVIHNRTSAS